MGPGRGARGRSSVTLRGRLATIVVLATLGAAVNAALAHVGCARIDRRARRAAAARDLVAALLAVEAASAQYVRAAAEQVVLDPGGEQRGPPERVLAARERASRALAAVERALGGGGPGEGDRDEVERSRIQVLRGGFRRLASAIDALAADAGHADSAAALRAAVDSYERQFMRAIDEALADGRGEVARAHADLTAAGGPGPVAALAVSSGVAVSVLALGALLARGALTAVTAREEEARRAARDLAAERDGVRAALAASLADLEEERRALAEATHGHDGAIAEARAAGRRAARVDRLAAAGALAADVAGQVDAALAPLLAAAGDPPAGRRCRALVRELGAFARAAGQASQPCDLNQVVRAAFAPVDARARSLGIRLDEELAADLPAIHANRAQLEQVVAHLGENALDAMTEGGVLTVRTARDGSGAAIEVSDSGEGIAPGVLERVFEPFFTTRTTGEATGLGLRLVHEMVRQHGGAVTVATEVGRGTTMRVWLPRAAAPVPSLHAGGPRVTGD